MKQCTGLLLLLMATSLPAADAIPARVSELCERLSVGTVAELRSRYFQQMTEHEIDIARRSAVLSCINMHSMDASAADTIPVAALQESDSIQQTTPTTAKQEGASWLERLLESEHNEKEKLPAIRQHQRTGGK